MSDFVGWVGDMLTLNIATVGTVSVTLGLIIALGLIASASLTIAKRLRGR